MQFSRIITVAVITAVASTVTACSAPPPGWQGENTNLDLDQVSCADLAGFDDDLLRLAYLDLVDEGPWVLYTDEGAETWDAGPDVIKHFCADPANADLMIGDLVATTGNTPSCAEFAAAGPDARIAWLPALLVETGLATDFADRTPDEIVAGVDAGCLDPDSDGSLISAAFTYSTELARARREAEFQAAFPLSVEWSTTSKLGYVVNVSIRVANRPLSADEDAHPLNDEALVGETCGYDPALDIAFPARITLRNDSPNVATLHGAVTLNHSGYSSDATTGYIDSGSFCDGEEHGRAGLQITKNDIEPGAESSIVFFVLIKNYYSPRYPAGATGELPHFSVNVAPWTIEALSDPIVSTSPSTGAVRLG